MRSTLFWCLHHCQDAEGRNVAHLAVSQKHIDARNLLRCQGQGTPKSTGNPHIWWVKPWFPVDFRLNQSNDMECFIYKDLVGGLEDLDYFSIQLGQLGLIIPTDELIFFRGVGIPPTIHTILFGIMIPTDFHIFRAVETTNQGYIC